jgi:hypothetical protein
MSSRSEFDRIADAVRSASASTEARFLDLGSRLGTAIDTIAGLTQTFGLLTDEMQGDNLRNATNTLSQTMSRVAALARADNDRRNAFGQLAGLAANIQKRVANMGKAVREIGILSINVKIEAVNIGDTGLDFADFAVEIAITLQLAQHSLDQLGSELAGVGNHLRSAIASQVALAQQQTAAFASIPDRLATGVNAIIDRGKRAGAAALTVAQKTEQVGRRISSAVMALQIGDITRQRLDHVEYALSIVADILGPPGDGKAVRHGDWTVLTKPQCHALALLCSRMQSAQLLDAADQLDHEVRQILSSLQELAADALDILELGNAAVGVSNDGRGIFLHQVEGQVAEVSKLLDGLETARREAGQVAVAVTGSTTRLVSHTSNLNSLEDDIRIMGLNTTLKCGRLGVSGRPLIVIAQELRIYANQIAMEASAVTVSLDSIMAIAGVLAQSDREERTADLETVAKGMANSVSWLGAAGRSLADALTTLARDTRGVSELLRETVGRSTVHEELSQALRSAARDIAGLITDSDSEADIATPEANRMLELLLFSYTMDRERVIHGHHSAGRSGAMAPSAPAVAAPADFEDFFL